MDQYRRKYNQIIEWCLSPKLSPYDRILSDFLGAISEMWVFPFFLDTWLNNLGFFYLMVGGPRSQILDLLDPSIFFGSLVEHSYQIHPLCLMTDHM